MMYFVLFSWPAKRRSVPPPIHVPSHIMHMQRRPMGPAWDINETTDSSRSAASPVLSEESSTKKLRGGSKMQSDKLPPSLRGSDSQPRQAVVYVIGLQLDSGSVAPRKSRSSVPLLVQMLTPDRVSPQDTAFVHRPSSACDGVEEKLTGAGGLEMAQTEFPCHRRHLKGRISIKDDHDTGKGRGVGGPLQLGIVHGKGRWPLEGVSCTNVAQSLVKSCKSTGMNAPRVNRPESRKQSLIRSPSWTIFRVSRQ
ncbi:hypothetical protein CGRA01v4_06551 [Colletotrichum graminicola]|nr:hypothetical protein CGRA01v4_06551 [Colletotrichum graminicola]